MYSISTNPLWLRRGSIIDLTLCFVLFSRFNIFGIRVATIFFIYIIFLYLIKLNPINHKVIISILVIFIYSIVSYYERNNMEIYDLNFQEGVYRPLLMFMQLSMEIFFSFIILNSKEDILVGKFKLLYCDYIFIASGIIYIGSAYNGFSDYFGLIHTNNSADYFGFRGFGNEPGTWIFHLLIRMLLFTKEFNFRSMLLAFCYIILMIITKSSIIILIPAIIYWTYSKNTLKIKVFSILFVFIASTLIYIYFGDGIIDKLLHLVEPTDNDGRYVANFISLNAISDNPILGYGLDSFDNVRRFNSYGYITDLDLYDHGGSDILNLIVNFGIIIFIFVINFVFKLFKSSGAIFIFFFILIPLSIKGQGLYSIGYISLWSCFLLYSKTQYDNYLKYV